jgi:hypothetical protein
MLNGMKYLYHFLRIVSGFVLLIAMALLVLQFAGGTGA